MYTQEEISSHLCLIYLFPTCYESVWYVSLDQMLRQEPLILRNLPFLYFTLANRIGGM